MATLTRQQIALSGLEVTLASAGASGDKTTPGDTTFIYVHNASGSTRTVTVDSVRASSYGTDEDLVVSVANGAIVEIGPLPANRFAGTDGLVSWTYDSHTSVTVAAIFI